MLEYISHVTITIDNAINIADIREALTIYDPKLSFEQNLIHLQISSIGSPSFLNIAKSIWWANKEYCDIQFLVTQSNLKYSSPTIFTHEDAKNFTEQ